MATLNVLFNFDSSAQGFTFTGFNVFFSGAWESTGGNPNGCLLTALDSNHANYCYFSLTTTYAALGIPSGSTITGISALKCDVMSTMGAGCNWAFGTNAGLNPITSQEYQGMTVQDVTSGEYIWMVQTNAPGGGLETSSFPWTTVTNNDNGPLTGLRSPQTGSVTIWLGNDLGSTGNLIQGLFDNAGFTVTYSQDLFLSVTEAGDAVDAVSSTWKSTGTISEPDTSSDLVSGSVTVSVSESGDLSDSPDATGSYHLTVDEPDSSSDTVGGTLIYNVNEFGNLDDADNGVITPGSRVFETGDAVDVEDTIDDIYVPEVTETESSIDSPSATVQGRPVFEVESSSNVEDALTTYLVSTSEFGDTTDTEDTIDDTYFPPVHEFGDFTDTEDAAFEYFLEPDTASDFFSASVNYSTLSVSEQADLRDVLPPGVGIFLFTGESGDLTDAPDATGIIFSNLSVIEAGNAQDVSGIDQVVTLESASLADQPDARSNTADATSEFANLDGGQDAFITLNTQSVSESGDLVDEPNATSTTPTDNEFGDLVDHVDCICIYHVTVDEAGDSQDILPPVFFDEVIAEPGTAIDYLNAVLFNLVDHQPHQSVRLVSGHDAFTAREFLSDPTGALVRNPRLTYPPTPSRRRRSR